MCQEERNAAEREVQQYERLLQETKAELTEQVYLWERKNQELSLAPEVLQEISRKIQEYEQGKDYSEIRELAKPRLYEKESSFTRERLLLEQNLETESQKTSGIGRRTDRVAESERPGAPAAGVCTGKPPSFKRKRGSLSAVL